MINVSHVIYSELNQETEQKYLTLKLSMESRSMSVESKKAADQANSEKPTPKDSKASLKEIRSPTPGDCSSPGKTHDKMGSMLSNIARRITPNPTTAHGGSGLKSSKIKSDADLIAPDHDELPSREGSPSSLEHAASPEDEYLSGLLWPYVNSRAPHDDPELDHPLRLRRPALYEEYWSYESDSESSQRQRRKSGK